MARLAPTLGIGDGLLTDLDPHHLRDRVTHKLSGGEKRLVTLATVQYGDGPRGAAAGRADQRALDPKNSDRLAEILEALPQPVLLVSHDPAFRERIAPCALELTGGRLVPV